jgi:farnesyl diphosphate synthase
MRHAALDGGKRMRPLLVYATGTAFGADATSLDSPAAAVELIHAYSLVHDDLPAMDDDSLRRGKPTVHVAFDEATAILAGDALQSLAFELLAEAALPGEKRVAMLRELAVATGARGMCGGQALDIDATGNGASIPIEALQRLHALKTGALLRASIRLGAFAAGVDPATMQRLDQFADALGLAFQIRDDLLDYRRRQRHARQDGRQGCGAGQGHVPRVARRRRQPRAPAGAGLEHARSTGSIRRTHGDIGHARPPGGRPHALNGCADQRCVSS